MRKPVIMDCDPGHDDAIALILAYASEELEIKGVTTVAGNQTVEKTTSNALKVLSFIGAEVPVAKGCSGPLFRDLITAGEVHGESGLDGPDLPEPSFEALPMTAVELMVKIIEESDVPVTLIPTGALTNVGLLLMTHPELKERIERISLMGGACYGGNWTPAAEFNILVDPEAADIVFRSGIPITMSGLDVTHKALIKHEDIERFRTIGTKTAVMVAELMDFFAKFHEENFDFGGSPLHDPCAVAWLLQPSLFSSKSCYVAIETGGRLTTGCTVVDTMGLLGKEANTEVLFDIDRIGFVDLLAQSLERLD